MHATERLQEIRRLLEQAFSPTHLEVIDESVQHHGHVGASGGAGHYAVIISAALLQNVSRVEAHRKVYAVLNHLIPDEIHALRITVRPSI